MCCDENCGALILTFVDRAVERRMIARRRDAGSLGWSSTHVDHIDV